jgi:predicted HNH restriction endonuclease
MACYGLWQRKHRKGANSPRWKGGASGEREEWMRNGGLDFNRACRKRDSYTCQRCGREYSKFSKGLHVHHKASFADYPSLRCEERNGMCLCKECHMWLHSNEGELVRLRWELDAVHELLLDVAS